MREIHPSRSEYGGVGACWVELPLTKATSPGQLVVHSAAKKYLISYSVIGILRIFALFSD